MIAMLYDAGHADSRTRGRSAARGRCTSYSSDLLRGVNWHDWRNWRLPCGLLVLGCATATDGLTTLLLLPWLQKRAALPPFPPLGGPVLTGPVAALLVEMSKLPR
jgi:hypothetical protein